VKGNEYVQDDTIVEIEEDYACEDTAVIKWLCHIFANTKYFIYDYEDSSSNGEDFIINKFEEIRILANNLHKEARTKGKFKWIIKDK
jgi:hypothetical protein